MGQIGPSRAISVRASRWLKKGDSIGSATIRLERRFQHTVRYLHIDEDLYHFTREKVGCNGGRYVMLAREQHNPTLGQSRVNRFGNAVLEWGAVATQKKYRGRLDVAKPLRIERVAVHNLALARNRVCGSDNRWP